MEPTKSPKSGPARASAAKRYGPLGAIVAIGVIVALVVALTGGSDDDKKKAGGGGSQVSTDKGWPLLTDDNASTEDWGEHCDEETGRVAIPWLYAAPCAKQLQGDNGGATATGVTADSIKVVYYQTDPAKNPLQAASVRGSGAEVSPETGRVVFENYLRGFESFYNTYGRKVEIVNFTGSGGPMDEIAARADAKAIADMKPFAVIGGANQTPVWSEELVANKIMCLGDCSLAVPEETVKDSAPFIQSTGPTPEQAAQLTAELVIKQLKGKAAEFGGDDVKTKTRVFGVAHYNTVDNQQGPAFEVLKDELDKGGVKVAAEQEFQLDLARGAEIARTVIAKMKAADVTTIIYTGDPIMPSNLTKEATAQNYFPEWVIGPNVLVDIAVFGRTYDPAQWKHAFGVNLSTGRVNETANQGRALYQWFTGNEPENNTYGVILPGPNMLLAGIHAAGPNLTPETFAQGLRNIPVLGGTPLQPRTSRGEHGIWPTFDWGGGDDVALIWWDPEAVGENEIGVVGPGLYQYTDEGNRYTFGKLPKDPVGFFDKNGSITIYETVPPDMQPPKYPSPAAG